VLTFEQIKELIDLVSERGLQSVEIERSGFRVRIDGKAKSVAAVPAEGSPVTQPVLGEGTVPIVPAGEAGSSGAALTAAEVAEAVSEEEGLHLLRSPIVGTFYTAPSPDADPYVGVGDRVKRGQVLCIVEAMKLMNEIESDEDGVIEKVFTKNAQPVEYGEPLFTIRSE
jgi:acetyl-CoA carboxylase biotin carboxyl carrier protein